MNADIKTNGESHIEERAAEWILRQERGDDTAAERQAFEAWLAADSRHRIAYLRLSQMWEQADGLKVWRPLNGTIDSQVLTPAVLANAAPQTGRARVTAAKKSVGRLSASHSHPLTARIFYRPQALAAMFALTIVVGLLWWSLSLQQQDILTTQVGGYQRVPLEDGSVLQLNTDTKIRINFSNARREVQLLRGEAYLEIAHDARRPFEVLAGDTVVRALGTAFAVRLRDAHQVEVLVKEGRVAVRNDKQQTGDAVPANEHLQKRLTAGDAAVAKAGDVAVQPLDAAELVRRLAWQTGQVSFYKQTLSEVVAEFNRYNRRQVRIADPAIASLEVGGSFKATDLESFVAAMRRAVEVRIEETPEEVLLYAP